MHILNLPIKNCEEKGKGFYTSGKIEKEVQRLVLSLFTVLKSCRERAGEQPRQLKTP